MKSYDACNLCLCICVNILCSFTLVKEMRACEKPHWWPKWLVKMMTLVCTWLGDKCGVLLGWHGLIHSKSLALRPMIVLFVSLGSGVNKYLTRQQRSCQCAIVPDRLLQCMRPVELTGKLQSPLFCYFVFL